MNARLKILTGARAGSERMFDRSPVTVGRHPDADLRFDPHQDLAVSGKHAVLSREGASWIIRDVGSQNGTLVNDLVIDAPTPLRDGDVLQFGRGGPTVAFSVELAPGEAQVPPPGPTRPDSRAPRA